MSNIECINNNISQSGTAYKITNNGSESWSSSTTITHQTKWSNLVTKQGAVTFVVAEKEGAKKQIHEKGIRKMHLILMRP